MILVTCKKINCPTPHFYVNTKAGKVHLTFPVSTPEAQHPVPKIIASRIAAMSEYKLSQELPDKFTPEEIELIKKWYEQMQLQISQDNLGITTLEHVEEATDYLVVYCESNHQNYIPLKDKNTPLIEDSK